MPVRLDSIDELSHSIRLRTPRLPVYRGLGGRIAELTIVAEGLATVADGDGSLILVEGGAGTGKTAVLRWAAQAARESGHIVFSVACSSYESVFELNLIEQLCDERVDSATTDLQTVCRDLYRFVVDAARRAPVLIVVDDLQWCDRSSLFCLAFLARRLGGHPVTILCSQLSGDDGIDLVLLDEMRRAHHTTSRIRLGPLPLSAVEEMIEDELGTVPASQRAAIAAWTGTNPFLLAEVLGTLRSGTTGEEGPTVVPPSVLAWFLGRLPRSVPACLPVARAVAVLGDHAAPALVADAASVSAAESAHAVQALHGLGLLRPGELLAFSQPVVRAAVLGSIPAEELAPLHQVVGEHLRRIGASSSAIVSYLVDSQAITHDVDVASLMDAVRDAQENMPVPDQPTLLRKALAAALPAEARCEVLHMLGRAELDLDARTAAAHLDEARRLTTDLRHRVAIAADQAHALHALGRDDRATALLRESADALLADGVGDDEQLAQLAIQLATVVANAPGVQALSGWSLMGAPDLAAPDAWRVIDPVRSPALMLSWHTAARVALAAGDPWGLLASCTSRLSAPGLGPVRQILVRSLRAEILLLLGRVTQAVAETTIVMDLIGHLDGAGQQVPVVAALPPLVDTLVESGEADRASQLLAATGHTGDLPSRWHHTALLASRGRVRHALGDPIGAVADLLECGRRMVTWAGRAPHPLPWRVHAVPVLVDIGETKFAQRLAAEELAEARRRGSQPRELGIALRMAGQAAGGEEGMRLRVEAVDTLEQSPAALELARALGLRGQELCRTGRSRAGREQLKRACAIAGEAGAVMLYDELTTCLREAGGRVRRRGYGVEALTASERQVARMAADGRTNREIAGILFITQRTVEMHLTQAYRKLGVAGRNGLSTALAGG
ncbi:helix-turn-helix transcriptional regulator [Micromonospora craniellae]|uniref:helix-turn-helix transcriptional regulator n=1 Tax=Micromonospora craniellae TaxID=2294034 RepID=UPI0013145716|nr:LuxR family transcriptional regulator [Micromonospora craniellae]